MELGVLLLFIVIIPIILILYTYFSTQKSFLQGLKNLLISLLFFIFCVGVIILIGYIYDKYGFSETNQILITFGLSSCLGLCYFIYYKFNKPTQSNDLNTINSTLEIDNSQIENIPHFNTNNIFLIGFDIFILFLTYNFGKIVYLALLSGEIEIQGRGSPIKIGYYPDINYFSHLGFYLLITILFFYICILILKIIFLNIKTK